MAQARRDHFDFVSKMEDRGVEVYDPDCLAEVLKDQLSRAWVVDRRLTDYLVGPNIGREMRPWLEEMEAAELARYLIGGIAFHEIPKDVAGPFLSTFAETEPDGLRDRPAAQHPVHAGQLVVDLPRRDAQPDVLAGPPARDAAHHRGLQLPPCVQGRDHNVWL